MPKHKGAGILPYAIHDNKLYFLLGKENPGNDPKKNNLFCDFGGGSEKGESPKETAFREFKEESMNVYQHLDVKNKIKGSNISVTNGDYVCYLVEFPYGEAEPRTYNRVMEMLNGCRREKKYKNYVNELIPTCKIGLAEKSEMRWFTSEEIFQNKDLIRPIFLKTFSQIIKKLEK